MADSKTTCERCWHWQRIAHPLDFELGECGLFERQMRADQTCAMWEAKMSAAVAEPDDEKNVLHFPRKSD